MLRADGTAQLDANTGAQAQFDNLLVLYSASSLRDDGTTLDYDLSLGGGVWLNGSQLWHITWTQGTDSTFAFYDADGSVTMRETLDLGLTIDERLADGYYYSKSIRLLKYLLEHPEELEKPLKEEVSYE